MIITKGASAEGRSRRPTYFYDSARAAFGDFLDHAPGMPGPVLLPAFIGWSAHEGSGVFDPVSQRDIEAGFYALNQDLTADVGDVAHHLSTGRYAAVVVLNYYGRTDPSLTEVRRLADQAGALMVEDNAHAFFSAATGGLAGSVGDVALYSLHKMFPLPNGGMAVYRGGAGEDGQRTTHPEHAHTLLSYDWWEIARARRENFLHGTRLLRAAQTEGAPLELVWPDLAVTDVPQSLPIYVLTEHRDEIYERLNAAGLGVVSLYHTLIPELRDAYPQSNWAARHIMNLPVHQDVDPAALATLVETLHQMLVELDAR